MPQPRRFTPPWTIDEQTESFIVRDAKGQALAYIYFEDQPQRQLSMKRLSRDEAFLVAANIARLPSVPRQILKTFRGRRIKRAAVLLWRVRSWSGVPLAPGAPHPGPFISLPLFLRWLARVAHATRDDAGATMRLRSA